MAAQTESIRSSNSQGFVSSFDECQPSWQDVKRKINSEGLEPLSVEFENATLDHLKIFFSSDQTEMQILNKHIEQIHKENPAKAEQKIKQIAKRFFHHLANFFLDDPNYEDSNCKNKLLRALRSTCFDFHFNVRSINLHLPQLFH